MCVALTRLWWVIQVFLQERQRAHKVWGSGRMEILSCHKIPRCAAQLEESWSEVEFTWVWKTKRKRQVHYTVRLFFSVRLLIRDCLYPAACSRRPSCLFCRVPPRSPEAPSPHRTHGWSPCCCCGDLPPEDSWKQKQSMPNILCEPGYSHNLKYFMLSVHSSTHSSLILSAAVVPTLRVCSCVLQPYHR